jgi:hypothetical protein
MYRIRIPIALKVPMPFPNLKAVRSTSMIWFPLKAFIADVRKIPYLQWMLR